MNDAATYDALLEAGSEPAVPCPVCTGDEDAEPCGEACAALVARAERFRRVRGLYAQARTALAYARLYRAEERHAGGDRERDCLRQVQALRVSIRNEREVA